MAGPLPISKGSKHDASFIRYIKFPWLTTATTILSVAHFMVSEKCRQILIDDVIASEGFASYIHEKSVDLDYLKVIYHLYKSDSEEEEQATIAARLRREEQKRQRDKKLADLREQKQRYSPGMWNVNSVMLGGLGSEPPLQDVECEIKEATDILNEVEPTPCHEDIQKKMSAIWTVLYVPESQRLDMAIKYSSYEYRDRLQEVMCTYSQWVAK
ncbi:unnamed protein product [Ranitomeya imitator]|uniref:Uncharacterized protein n=1 Tax=Ranitomeya imitator TaxID=111125 RepID=A0ABN9L848_9NEOB|nr:unnamed protein product [Ranitomeya imitator]